MTWHVLKIKISNWNARNSKISMKMVQYFANLKIIQRLCMKSECKCAYDGAT